RSGIDSVRPSPKPNAVGIRASRAADRCRVRAPVRGPGSTTDPAEARYRFARPFLPVVCFDVPRLAAALFTVVLLDVAVRGLAGSLRGRRPETTPDRPHGAARRPPLRRPHSWTRSRRDRGS